MRKRRMEQELNHPHFVGVRLSDIELELLDRKAEILGVSRSECLRKLLVEKEIVHAGARITIGRRVLYSVQKVEKYLEAIAE